MRIAILGATSQIAKDLIVSFSVGDVRQLHLFARRPDEVSKWLAGVGLTGRYPANDFSEFAKQDFDAVINFVGVGNPVQAVAMGNSIFDVTLRFDEMVLEYLQTHPACRYLFLSSGAAYGSSFNEPANRNTLAVVAINDLAPHEWYGVAKLHAECRHRAHPELPIIDIRVFNYFSRTLDVGARFFITDIVRAIQTGTVLQTSPDHMVRDYLHPGDFYQLVDCVLQAPPQNAAVDCYSRDPVEKPALLVSMSSHFGLRYEVVPGLAAPVNATGAKPYYYSRNHKAASFGYQPVYSSLDTVLTETAAILGWTEGNTVELDG